MKRLHFFALIFIVLFISSSCTDAVKLNFRSGPSEATYGEYHASLAPLVYDNVSRVSTDGVVVTFNSVSLQPGSDFSVQYMWYMNDHAPLSSENPSIDFYPSFPKGSYGVTCVATVTVGDAVLRVYRCLDCQYLQ